MSQRIIPQPALRRASLRHLSTPAVSHDFDVVSDPPPARRIAPAEQAEQKPDEPPRQAE